MLGQTRCSRREPQATRNRQGEGERGNVLPYWLEWGALGEVRETLVAYFVRRKGQQE